MPRDLVANLNSENCNELIRLVEQCQEDYPFRRFFGKCTPHFHQMTKCLKEEKLQRRQKSYEKSLETKAKLRQLFKEEREREKANS